MDTRRGGDSKAPRKDAELRRLAKFYAVDRPPRKRLRTLLDFLKNPSGAAGSEGNLVGTVQQLLAGAPKDAANAADTSAILSEFWADMSNCSMLFDVLSDCVTELETLYVPHENAFRRRKKTLEAEDWNEVFEGLEVLIRNNIPLIHDGWKNHGFTLLFAKLLKRDNHMLIKKYAFRCLALYTDATRNMQQLAVMGAVPAALSNGASARSTVASLAATVDDDGASTDDDAGGLRGTAFLAASRRNVVHLELLRESVDFAPYGGGSIMLPDKFINQGVHVDGWIRSAPTQAEEPVDMLKFIMDLSLEREDPKIINHPKMNHKARGDRFEFWTELVMRFYMPLLFPKVCIKVKLKEEGDNMGFFHHCPGSFQRVVARWIYKLRSKQECMEILWSRREFSEVVLETVRQRFAYRDNELVLDAIKFYSGICTGGQYVPKGMQGQIHETTRAMISHVSQLFHPSVQLDDAKILLHCIDLLEVISQRSLDDYSSTYLRKFVISTIDNCVTLRDPNNVAILSAMISIVLHVWMHAAIVSKAGGQQIWMELTIAIRRWLVNPNDAKVIGAEVINCWKRELRFASCLLMYIMDQGQSELKVTADGAVLVPHTSTEAGKEAAAAKDSSVRQGYLQSAANFLMNSVLDVGDATLLLDRVLHLIPPPTMSSLLPFLHLNLQEGMLQLVDIWIDSAICSQRATPTVLHSISPSTVWALFGEWFLPACELETAEFQNSRCVAIVALCRLCSVRCANGLTRGHLQVLARIIFKGITSPSGVVVSTVLQRAAPIFTLNLDGMNALVPAFLYAVDQIIVQNIWERAEQSKVKSSNWNRELTAALDIVFSILALPKRFPTQDFVNWHVRLANNARITEDKYEQVREIVEEIPETDENFHVVVGRVLVRIASLPFTDISTIKKRALWGLYTLTSMHLKPLTGAVIEKTDLAEWIEKIMEFCSAVDFSVSMTALSILQDLADFHKEVKAVDPMLIARIVMTLAVFAQQQVEEASMELQSAMENQGATADPLTGGDKNSVVSSARGSTSRHGSHHGSDVDSDSAGKNKTSPPQASPGRNGASPETPALRNIVQKTAAIFECLRFWVMQSPDVLHDHDAKKIMFSAIEAALVGSLPGGEWQHEVERARAMERRKSLPLLFLGLQMRASLDTEASQSWLKCFEETSLAAEALLMHLLHHINGFPSPAGVDQMISNCSELHDLDEGDGESGAEADSNAPGSLSFVFMDTMIITLVGSLDSPCARFVARDMTGLFTWEILPGGISPTVALRRSSRVGPVGRYGGSYDATAGEERDVVAGERGQGRGLEQFHLHRAKAAVRVEVRMSSNADGSVKTGYTLCQVCGGEKPLPPPSPRPSEANANSSNALPRLDVIQLPRAREAAILANGVVNSKGMYQFHEEGEAGVTGAASAAVTNDKKSGSRGLDADKMPGSGGGNKDERLERLERIAKQHEERNSITDGSGEEASSEPAAGALASLPPSKMIKRCECMRKAENDGSMTNVCGLFEMSQREANVGSLDDERCLLDLVLDGIPMVFRDCGGDTTDKTILGGRYSMNKYNLMEMEDSTNPLVNDAAEIAGFSFLQRLIHDEECYAQLKGFILKEANGGNTDGKELIEFCDAVKKYERCLTPSDRLGQASAIFWEFFSSESGRNIQFPPSVTQGVQDQLQVTQKSFRLGQVDTWCLPGSLFQRAITHVETAYFNGAGILDRFVTSLEPTGANGHEGSGKESMPSSSSSTIPSQLALFDSFSIMELNARIAHLALHYRSVDKVQLALSRPGGTGSSATMSTFPEDVTSMRVTALDVCRLFLAQSSLLTGDSNAGPDGHPVRRFKLLQPGAKLERSLKHLDKSPTRETMKIGVIYVGPAQRTQQELLRNESGSRAYHRFLSQLGWEIDLLSHRGFAGGLDCNPKSLSNGRTALYYATGHSEVMFHVVTKMPTKASDPQQIDKKRHVGNDYVHIVWTENDAYEYDPSTITSHFNDVQIVISPLRRRQHGLFLVKVHSKEKVPPFGPIQSGMVVHEADLVRLVRQTAMNANRVCRSQTMVYVRPYPTRKKLVDEIVERYADEYQESQLLSMLFATPSSSAATSGSVSAQ